MKRYILNQLVALDIAVNAITGGSPYMTISERAWVHKWTKTIRLIDTVFSWFGEKNHCQNSAEGDEQQYEVF